MIPVTVGGLFQVQAAARSQHVALEQSGRTLTYAAFDARTNQLARALERAGVTRGSRVGILSENRIEYVEAEFACAKLGAIAACLNWRQADPQLRHCIRLVRPSILISRRRG